MKAKYIKTVSGIDTWHITGKGQSFYTEFSTGHSQQQIENFYND